MKKRKRNSTSKLADEQPQANEPDGFWEPEDIQPEPRAPKRRSKTQPLSKNPIIAAIQRGLQRRGFHLTALSGYNDTCKPQEIRRFVGRVFDDETKREVGTVIIEALLGGDKILERYVKRAIKEADHLFHRDREKALLDEFARWVWTLPEPLPPKTELIKRFAKETNRDKLIEDYQWRRLRKALRLPKGETKPWSLRHEPP